MSPIRSDRNHCPLFPSTKNSKKFILAAGILILLFSCLTAQAAQVTLAWDANTEPDLVGYKLYYGTSSGTYPYFIEVGNVTTHTVSDLNEGATYFFVLTALNSTGQESGYSNEVSYAIPASNYTLTVSQTGTGSGTVTNTPAGTTFATGTVVSLSAAANVSSVFTGWSGACTGTVNPCTVTMSANRSVTANFNVKTFTLTASAGSGGAVSSAGTSTVNYGDNKTYTITPNSGYQIANVTVDGASVGAVSTYAFSNVTANHTLAATFSAVPTYTLTVSKTGTGTGTVTNTPAGTTFATGTVVSLSAAANVSSVFTGWSGACTGTVNPCTVTMSANRSVTANFNVKTFTLTASAGSGGAVSSAGTSTVNYGDNKTYTITPNSGYRIVGVTVDGASVGAVGTYTFASVTANHTITATFAATTYSLTVSQTGTGSGTVSNTPAGSSFSAGTTVSLTAAANAGSVFTGWSGACTGTVNPCTVILSADRSVTAIFNLEIAKPVSTINRPLGGSTLRTSSYTISGTATDETGSGIQRVEVSTDGGTTWEGAEGTSSWEYTWTIAASGSYVLKSRAINNLGATEIPGAGVTVSADPYQPTTVRVDGKQLLVNGTPFTVKGVVYSPTPVGDDPDQAPFGDYFTNTYSGIHGRDLPVLRNLKANAVRLYHWEKTADHFDFLDQAYNEGVDPIYIIAGYWINEGLDIDPASSGNVREALKADFRKMVAAHKDHPAILMWSIGQNLNHPEAYGGSLPHLFSLINEMAETAHLEEGTKAHPVTTALADDRLAEILSQWESSVPSLDIWGANIYRGNSFGTLFSDINAASQKPLLILEYGIDAFDNNQGDEYEKTGTPVQADVAETLWKEIASNIQTCAGGALMAYSDEWWRGSACSINGNPAVQDACGYPTNSQPDGQVNEEWWGLVRIHDNGTDPDVVEPRAVYYRLQSLWAASAKSLTVVSPNGGELWQVGRPQTVRWNFQGTLGKTVKIEVLRNGKLFYTITKKAALGTAGVGTYTWTPPWKVRTGEDYQIRVAAIEDTAVTDISDGDFSIKSIWMVRN